MSRFKQSVRFGLVEAFLLFTILAFGINLGIDYYAAKTSTKEIAHRLFDKHVLLISSELNSINNPVNLIVALGRSKAKDQGGGMAEDWRSANRIFMPIMKEYPFVTSVNYGNDRGDGYLILRVGTTWKNRIKRASEPGMVTWITLTEDGTAGSVVRTPDDYDPRKRPWYGIAADDVRWSRPYVFRTTRDLGVTASFRISPHEVLGVDIMLKDLSRMLETLSAQEEISLSLVDRDGYIWADSDVHAFEMRLAETGAAPRITEEGHEAVRAIIQAAESGSGGNRSNADIHLKGYFHSAVKNVALAGAGSVYLVSLSRQSREMRGFLRLMAIETSLFVLLLAVFGYLFAARYLLPIRKITEAVVGCQSDEKAELPVFARNDEIGKLSREFRRMTEVIGERNSALQTSETRYREICSQFHALLDAIPDNLTLQSPDLRVLWANNGAAAGLNKNPEELTGAHCYELWHNRTAPCEPCPVLRSFQTGEPAEETVTTPDGRIWDLRTIPIKEDGRVVSVVEMGRDITEHRQLETRYFQAQKMEVVGQLAGGVAHDFNNILSAIVGYGHLALMKTAADDPVRLNIENMLEGADRAARLTKELLLFSRKQVSDRKPVDLNEIAARVEKFLRRVIGEDLSFTVRPADAGLPVLADSHQMEQALMNLATNARDAMPEGGAFTIQAEKVKLNEDFTKAHGYGKPGAYALLTVSDTGQGMDEKTRQRIFEPFFTTKEVGKGTGLGLAVVYGIIKQHDGFINVYSEPGKGTTFRIYLPLIRAAATEEAPIKKEAPAGRGAETILLAEDDDALRKLAVTVLTHYGYTVITAADGEDAVEKFRENADRIQLLLFDLIMPKMNGKEACDEIRKLRPDVKVIFASGYAPDMVQRKVKLENHATLIFKPVSPNELLNKVRSVLDGAG